MPIRIRRRATASWQGAVEDGRGEIRVQSGALNSPYSLRSRVGDEPATNPEELIGAAHAGCFAMSLANLLSNRGFAVNDVTAKAIVHLDEGETGFAISQIELEVTGDIPDVDEETFVALADEAKRTCPVSRALAGTEIALTAQLHAYE